MLNLKPVKMPAEDLKLSSVDIFNIIASPTISFLAQDATELSKLILEHGIPKTTDDDAERGGEKGNTSLAADSSVQALARQLTPMHGVRRKNTAASLAEKLASAGGERKNAGTLNTQLEMERQREREVRIKKALAKELVERYDRTFMTPGMKKEMKLSLQKLTVSKEAGS